MALGPPLLLTHMLDGAYFAITSVRFPEEDRHSPPFLIANIVLSPLRAALRHFLKTSTLVV